MPRLAAAGRTARLVASRDGAEAVRGGGTRLVARAGGKEGGEDHLNDRSTDGRTTAASISRLSMSMPASEWSPDLPPRPPNERLTAEQGQHESRVELK